MKANEITEIETELKEKIFTVSEFLDFLNEILIPNQAIVQGEIGQKIDIREKYITFNLLDKTDKSVLKCFVWKDVLDFLGIELKEGMEIKVFGIPKIYKSPFGSEFEFEVKKIWLVGEGILKLAFEALKKKLEKEGLFDQKYKKQIPKFCQKIGLITSKYGKGAKPDFERHLGKFGFKVYFYDVRVEGIFAIQEIVSAIRWFNENLPNLDVLVIIRGGGDWESLQAFNSEEVARAIFASKIPVICGIGHESDFTIADFVADLRASTPTDAAKILTENWQQAAKSILSIEKNINFYFEKSLKGEKEKLDIFQQVLISRFQKEIFQKNKELRSVLQNLKNVFRHYREKFQDKEREFLKNSYFLKNLMKQKKEKIAELSLKLESFRKRWLERIKSSLKEKEKNLFFESPIFKLKQGYTLTFDSFGKIIKDPKKLKLSQKIKTQFFKGQVISEVKKIRGNEPREI